MKTREERISMARAFRKSFPMSIAMRDDFDLWIIDHDLAEDPGTDDSASGAYKGFVQQRNAARKAINSAATLLGEVDAYSIDINKAHPEQYAVTPWTESATDVAQEIGNRIHKFSRNKVRSLGRLRNIAIENACSQEGVDELVQMLSQLEGYGVVLHRRVTEEVQKYNKAVLQVEEIGAKLLAQVEEEA